MLVYNYILENIMEYFYGREYLGDLACSMIETWGKDGGFCLLIIMYYILL